MTRTPLAALTLIAVLAVVAPALGAEQPVDPYPISDANAGAEPRTDDSVFRAFNGKPGIDRVVATTIAASVADPRISDIFEAADLERLQRTLSEQFCYLLGGGCAYTGRDMKTAHKDMGLRNSDFNALVEHLQDAMDKEGVSFRAQNKLLAKLAPMQRTTVER